MKKKNQINPMNILNAKCRNSYLCPSLTDVCVAYIVFKYTRSDVKCLGSVPKKGILVRPHVVGV
jgi:hypothetical protein